MHGRNNLNIIFRLENVFFKKFCHTRYRKKPKWGSRYVTPNCNIFQYNVWYVQIKIEVNRLKECSKTRFKFNSRDDVEWDEEQEEEAMEKVKINSEIKLSRDLIEKYETDASKYWNEFYNIHVNNFFKDRHWLFTEFPELASKNDQPQTIFEVGCGVGNTIFPILQYSTSKNLLIYGSDFSPNAIEILKSTPEYNEKRCKAFVLDATEENWEVPFKENSIDIIILIFVLSAINPNK